LAEIQIDAGVSEPARDVVVMPFDACVPPLADVLLDTDFRRSLAEGRQRTVLPNAAVAAKAVPTGMLQRPRTSEHASCENEHDRAVPYRAHCLTSQFRDALTASFVVRLNQVLVGEFEGACVPIDRSAVLADEIRHVQQQVQLGALEIVAGVVDKLADAKLLVECCERRRDEVCLQGAEAALGELAPSEFEAQLKYKE
jgi:hypothetical protein